MISQINPHFIYNTLNNVIYIASKNKNQEIVDLMRSFISILRYTINIKEESVTSLNDEIAFTKNYIFIQQIRYKDSLEICWEIDETILDCPVPKSILQIFVENSIIHGIIPAGRKGIIWIEVTRQEEDIRFKISDNGIGMDNNLLMRIMEPQKGEAAQSGMRSIGIENIVGRLKYLYGSDYKFLIESKENCGTTVKINIPIKL